MKRFIVCFVAVLFAFSLCTSTVFALSLEELPYPSDQKPTKDYLTKTYHFKIQINNSPDNWDFYSEWLNNPDDFVVFSGGGLGSATAPPMSDENFAKATPSYCNIVVVRATDFLQANYKQWVKTNRGWSYLFLTSVSDINTMRTMIFKPVLKGDTVVVSSYQVTTTSFQPETILSKHSASSAISKCPSMATDKVTFEFVRPPDPPDPPTPSEPDPPITPPTPPNPEMIPWYPSDGLTFLQRYIPFVAGNSVNVGIIILSVILGVLIMIRIVKMYSNPRE